jgi:hypothetical protein
MDPASASFSGMNWLGLGLAFVANLVIGFIWYAPWFPTGAAWVRMQGMDPKNMPKAPGGEMAKSMVLGMLIGPLLMLFVFTHNFWVYLDAFRNTATGGKAGYKLSIMDGIMGGVFTWLGFIVPLNLNSVAFDRKPWKLFFINTGYYLITLVVAGILLVTVGKFTLPSA